MKEIKIGKHIIGGKHHSVFFIAEAGINHDGDIEKAKLLIQKAKWARADAIKFQSFKTDSLWNKEETIKLLGKDTAEEVYQLFKKVELSREDHFILKRTADEVGIIFLSTPFDYESVDLLLELEVPAIKIASGDLTYHSFLQYIASKKLPILLSTGMSNMEEVSKAVEIVKNEDNSSLILLQCTSSYPAPYEDMALDVIREYENRFSLPAGISDHSLGSFVPRTAAAHGAKVIEKHFTLNKDDKGPDHCLSLEPEELKSLISEIRKIELLFGFKGKNVRTSESETRKIGRRGIYASRDIQEGEFFSRDNLFCQRPCTSISAENERELYNKQSNKMIKKGFPINYTDLKDKI
jgi:N,N'-diacetyllegionaminate synthase